MKRFLKQNLQIVLPGIDLDSVIGFSYHNLSNYDKALENYVKALIYKPAAGLEIIIQSRLASVYAVKNNPDKAFARLDKAIALGYGNLTELGIQYIFTNRNGFRVIGQCGSNSP